MGKSPATPLPASSPRRASRSAPWTPPPAATNRHRSGMPRGVNRRGAPAQVSSSSSKKSASSRRPSRSRMMIDPDETVIRPSRCHSLRCLFVLSRVMPTSVPSCCCDSLTSIRVPPFSRRRRRSPAAPDSGQADRAPQGTGYPQAGCWSAADGRTARRTSAGRRWDGLPARAGNAAVPAPAGRWVPAPPPRRSGVLPSSSAISPKNSPLRTMLSVTSLPSEE